VRRHELAIEKRVAAHLQARDQPGEGDLRRVRGLAEHALAEEGAAERDPVKTAGEGIAVPDFDRMGVAEAEER
jgi:hypothetical protein